MTTFNFVLLYVENPPKSAAFYADLLDKPVIESASTFAMLPLTESVMLGLWSKYTVEPKATPVGGSEVAFAAESAEAVRETCASWRAKGLTIAQEPLAMDFGTTFVALDPDGHRLRVLFTGG